MNPFRSIKFWILVRLLRRAAHSFKSKKSYSYPGNFENTSMLANFIAEAADQFEKGDFQSGKKLWNIFAPTCEWDDANGRQNFGNWIFAILDPDFRPTDDR